MGLKTIGVKEIWRIEIGGRDTWDMISLGLIIKKWNWGHRHTFRTWGTGKIDIRGSGTLRTHYEKMELGPPANF